MSNTENQQEIENVEEIISTESENQYSNFLIFWVGQLFSIFGSEIVQFAIVWWITIETQNPIYLSLAMFLAFVPKIIIGPIAGVFVDRWNRKVLIGVTDFLQAVASFGIIILFLGGWENIWVIILINTFRGICQSFHSPAISSILPVVVPKKKLNQFNSVDYLLNGVVSIIGPIIGAFLLIYFDVGQVLWIDLISFMIALGLLIPLKLPSVQKCDDSENEDNSRSFSKDFKEGFNVIKSTKGLGTLIFIAIIGNFLLAPINTLISFFISIIHSGTSGDLGIVMASMQAGIIIGAIILSLKKNWKNKIRAFMIGTYMIFFGIMIIAISGEFWMMTIGGFICTLGLPLVSIMLKTVIQTLISPDKLGRVVSILGSISTIIMPIGILISGPLANLMGVGTLFLLSSIFGIIATTIVGSFGNLKILQQTAD